MRATIKKHAAGGTITEIEKEIVDGVLVYEAEVVRDGKEWDIRVSASGKYLGTETDEEPETERDDEDHAS